jgi:drug/metabolite transporter (DMT)-like permease
MLFLPSLIDAIRLKEVNTLKAGAELGIYTFLGFAFQAIGLETTTASRSAFLLYLNVKLVPFFAAIFLKRKIEASTWISALFAVVGTSLLSTDGGPLNVGK